MASLSIRDLPDDVKARLRLRAARAGRSMEAEARRILTEVCRGESEAKPARSLQDVVVMLYGRRRPRKVVEGLIADRRQEAARDW